jgi:hypothetical protein
MTGYIELIVIASYYCSTALLNIIIYLYRNYINITFNYNLLSLLDYLEYFRNLERLVVKSKEINIKTKKIIIYFIF